MLDYIHALGVRQPSCLMTLSQPTNEICRQIEPFPLEYRFEFSQYARHPANLMQSAPKLDRPSQRALIFSPASRKREYHGVS